MCIEHSSVMSQDLCSLVVVYFTFGRIIIFMNQGHRVFHINHNQGLQNVLHVCISWNRNSSVGIMAGYGLDGSGSIPVSARFHSSSQHPDRLWVPPSFLSNATRGSFPVVKAART
jgi:hypothetical protein